MLISYPTGCQVNQRFRFCQLVAWFIIFLPFLKGDDEKSFPELLGKRLAQTGKSWNSLMQKRVYFTRLPSLITITGFALEMGIALYRKRLLTKILEVLKIERIRLRWLSAAFRFTYGRFCCVFCSPAFQLFCFFPDRWLAFVAQALPLHASRHPVSASSMARAQAQVPVSYQKPIFAIHVVRKSLVR